jgi:hypothetical protein
MIPTLLTGYASNEGSPTIADAVFIPLQVASLMALGYILKSDVPEERVAVA